VRSRALWRCRRGAAATTGQIGPELEPFGTVECAESNSGASWTNGAGVGCFATALHSASRFDLPMLLSERNYGSCDVRAERARRGGRGAWPFMPSKLVEVVSSSASPRRVRARGLACSRVRACRFAQVNECVLTDRAVQQRRRVVGVPGACARAVLGASRVVTACGSRAQARGAKSRMGGRSARTGYWMAYWLESRRRARACRAGGLGAPAKCKSGGLCAPGGFRTGGLCAPVGSKEP
jgi:hypothetical protein